MKPQAVFFFLGGITLLVVVGYAMFGSSTPSPSSAEVAPAPAPVVRQEASDALPQAREVMRIPQPSAERRNVARVNTPVEEVDPERDADPELKARRDADEQAIHHWGDLPEKMGAGQ